MVTCANGLASAAVIAAKKPAAPPPMMAIFFVGLDAAARVEDILSRQNCRIHVPQTILECNEFGSTEMSTKISSI